MAFCLRIYAIDRQDIWGDEAVSIQLSSGPLLDIIEGGAETVPPLYHILLHYWLRLGGASALAIRLLSAAFGTLGVAGIYILGGRVFGRRIGILAALTAAISPALVFYSQEARVYSVLAFLTVVSIYWTVRLADEPVRSRAWIAYLLASLAAGYTHYYGFFVILAENLVVIIHMLRRRRWRSLKKWLAAQAAIGLAYLPWIYIQGSFLTNKAGGRFEEWTLSVAAGMAEQTLTALAAGLSVSPSAARLIAIPFIVAALSSLFARPSNGTGKTLLIACVLVPGALAWLVNPLMPFFFPRYLLLTAPAYFILVASGIVVWKRLQRTLPAAGVLLLVLGSGYGLHGYYTDDAFLKGRYGQMMTHVQQNARSGDGLVLLNRLQRPLFEYYEPSDLDVFFFPRPEYPISDPRTAQDLSTIAANHPRLWLVRFGNPAEYDPKGDIHRWLSARGSKAYSGGWVDSDLSLYLMDTAGTHGSIQHPLNADLGRRVRLLGYALSADHVAPGDTFLLTLYWQAQESLAERYTVFTHLLDYEGRIQAQMDSEPQGGGLPTDRWSPGEVVQDNYALTVAADADPGLHVVEVGMYSWITGERLPVVDPGTKESLGDRVLLGTIEVIAP
jgi:hypothetical protein